MFRDAESAATSAQDQHPGRRVVAVIGIDRYREWPRLRNAVNDARAAQQAFIRLGFEQLTEPLFDENATSDAILKLVRDDLASLGKDDSLVLFFAGHGHTITTHQGHESIKTGYIIPVDGHQAGGSRVRWLRLDHWLSEVARHEMKHVLVFLDSCYSGIALGGVVTSRGMNPQVEAFEHLARRQSRRVVTSAQEDELAMDAGPRGANSLFTGCLIDALDGGIARHGELVTGSQLGLYLQQNVSKYAKYANSVQIPDFGAFERDRRGELVVQILTTTALEEAAEKAREEAAAKAREEAAAKAREEAAAKAREEAAAKARKEAAAKARKEAAAKAQAQAADKAQAEAADKARKEAADKARKEAAAKAQAQAAAKAQAEAADKAWEEVYAKAAAKAREAREEAADKAREEAADKAWKEVADRAAAKAREEAAAEAQEKAAVDTVAKVWEELAAKERRRSISAALVVKTVVAGTIGWMFAFNAITVYEFISDGSWLYRPHGETGSAFPNATITGIAWVFAFYVAGTACYIFVRRARFSRDAPRSTSVAAMAVRYALICGSLALETTFTLASMYGLSPHARLGFLFGVSSLVGGLVAFLTNRFLVGLLAALRRR